jgi:hypothetical protein
MLTRGVGSGDIRQTPCCILKPFGFSQGVVKSGSAMEIFAIVSSSNAVTAGAISFIVSPTGKIKLIPDWSLIPRLHQSEIHS